MRARLFSFIILCIVTSGCKVGPKYHPPEPAIPEQWSSYGDTEYTSPEEPEDCTGWWTVFNDPILDSLICRAAQSNLDIAEAISRIFETRALRKIAFSKLFPQVDGTAQYTHHFYSFVDMGLSPGLPLAELTPLATQLLGAPIVFKRHQDIYQVGFDATWELDIFGRRLHEIDARQAEVEAANENFHNVLIMTLAEVARNYMELRGFQKQIEVTQNNIRLQQETLDLERDRFTAGISYGYDISKQEGQLAVLYANLPPLDTNVQSSIYRLSVLLGAPPLELQEELLPTMEIPKTPDIVNVGIPSDLLRRRPDIRRAERNLAAANARIGMAVADMFPRLTLFGGLGWKSPTAETLTAGTSDYWFLNPALTMPIFNAGKLKANVRLHQAREEAQFYQYGQVVLNALEEVENSLTTYVNQHARNIQLQQAVAADQKTFEDIKELWLRGLRDYFFVLDAQKTLYRSQELLVQSDRALATSLVALYKALGGEF